jgi:glycosyltransferase involved in cell wall biosynthesis
LRVAFVGNIANVHYRIAAALRDQSDLDAHLFIDSDEVATSRPESDDPSLASGYPEWIHEGRWQGPRNTIAPGRSPVVRELRGFDLVVASGVGPIFARHAGRPWCFLVTGGDLTLRPFPLRFMATYGSAREKAVAALIGFHQRRALRDADEIWTQEFAPFRDALDRLEIDSSRVADLYVPMAVDTELFKPASAGTRPVGAFGESDFVVFHPSRLMMRQDARRRATGQWKANDRLIRGYARFVRSGVAARPLLVMPDTTLSPDLAEAKTLVRRLGIDREVLWLAPPRAEGFTRMELVPLYQHADVVADDFGVGWFGLVVLEALACGTPVVSHVDSKVIDRMYPEHPILLARDEETIAARLAEVAAGPESAPARRREARAWIETYHSRDAVTAKYQSAIKGAVARLTTEPRRAS